MDAFSKIRKRAEKRKGGKSGLERLLPKVLTPRTLSKKPDDRYLSAMTKAINKAGFNWTVIENKWPQFEEAFFAFNPHKLARLSAEQWEAYTSDKRVVRNWQIISALRANTTFVLDTAREHGSFAKFIATWPTDDQVGLGMYLKKHGSRLGGATSQWFMRSMNMDTYVLTQDVVGAMKLAGVEVATKPTSQRDLKAVQQAMNHWHDQSGLPYAHISRILACSTGVNYEQL